MWVKIGVYQIQKEYMEIDITCNFRGKISTCKVITTYDFQVSLHLVLKINSSLSLSFQSCYGTLPQCLFLFLQLKSIVYGNAAFYSCMLTRNPAWRIESLWIFFYLSSWIWKLIALNDLFAFDEELKVDWQIMMSGCKVSKFSGLHVDFFITIVNINEIVKYPVSIPHSLSCAYVLYVQIRRKA